MNALVKQRKIFARRRARVRAKVHGTAERPRLTVFKSNKYVYAQIVDDDEGRTLVSCDSREMKPLKNAGEIGTEIAKRAKAAKIDKIVFDRGGYSYAGNIKMIAEAARKGGLKF